MGVQTKKHLLQNQPSPHLHLTQFITFRAKVELNNVSDVLNRSTVATFHTAAISVKFEKEGTEQIPMFEISASHMMDFVL